MATGAVTGGNDDDDGEGGVKVKELGEGDPQWQQIQEVVKEQLERAGIKAEGRPEHTNTHTQSILISLCVCLCEWSKDFIFHPEILNYSPDWGWALLGVTYFLK